MMTTERAHSPVILAAALGLGVFAFCLLGIAARLGMDLSNLWIANAFMLGVLVRFPATATGWSWLTATLAFVAADLVTGSDLVKSLVLSAANLVSVAVAWLLLSRLQRRDQRLQRPRSMLRLLIGLTLGSAAAGLIGAMADPWLFNGAALTGAAFWFTSELVNYLLVLPLLLTLPDRAWWRQTGKRVRAAIRHPWQLAPAAALLVSILVGVVIGGPGAVAFPVPALLWCALSYSLFSNALAVFVFGTSTLLAASTGHLVVAPDFDSRAVQLSFRLGVSLIMMAPLALASTMAAREQLLAMLRFMAEHDDLTGLPNRSAFLRHARDRLRELVRTGRPVAVLMIDIDRFKTINDRFGHAGGDQVLVKFSSLLRESLRSHDYPARFGGEEFAVILPACSAQQAAQIAERLRQRVSDTPITLDDGRRVATTVSIGMAHCFRASGNIDDLLAAADQALYGAKEAGRDRVESASPAAIDKKPQSHRARTAG